MKQPYNIFIGWDSREKVAYEVLKHSIERQTTSQHNIIPLYHKELRQQGFFQRPWLTEALTGNTQDLIDGKPFSTEFSHTRFLVPLLMGFKGWALFMDCDMLMRCDVKEIFNLCDDRYACMVVKHRQEVRKAVKMDGSPQQNYFRKNWSSFVLWNCGHEANKVLTKDMVNNATGGYLHGFSWLHENQIGALPNYYNWIEGCSPGNIHPRVIHYTLGGPWFTGYKDVAFSDEWWREYESTHADLPDPSDHLLNVDYGSLSK